MEADEIRYGVLGTGMMGIEHIHNIAALDGARVTAIADPEPSSRRAALDAGGDHVVQYADHRELLESDRCDVVVVATPNMTHMDVLLDVLDHDVHVLVEKPLCTTVADCQKVVEAAEGRAPLLWVGLEYRYMPPVARLVDEVRSGTVGDLHMLAIREHRFPFLAKVGAWNRFNRNTGGTLVEKCCHYFDLMALICAAPPTRVMASGGQAVNHLDERYDGETPDILDHAYVIVEFVSGARAMLDLCMFAEASTNQEELVAVGAEGKVEAFLPSGEVRIGRREDGWLAARSEIVVADDVAHEGLHHGSSYLEHVAFRDAILSGSAPTVGLRDGLLSVAMGEAAHRSIDEGRPVDLAEVLAV